MRPAAAGSALVEEHDAIMRGIEVAAMLRAEAGARASMQEERGLPFRIAALFYVKFMASGHA